MTIHLETEGADNMEHPELYKVVDRLGEIKDKKSEILAVFCPYCQGGSHRDKLTFSINKETGLFKCFRGKCGEEGNIYQLGKFLGVDIVGEKKEYFREYRQPKKVYKKPEIKNGGLSGNTIEYFKTRLISKKTLEKNKVTTDKHSNIMFNYYLNGEIVFIKYKIPRKQRIVNGKTERKSWREAGTRPILYGMDDCDNRFPLIIIEGEPDKLVLDECGVKNAVSIPSGTEDFTWIDECWDWMQQFREIIIWGDNDTAGKGFQQECISRLSDWKLRVVKCQYKDANVLLYEKNKELDLDKAKLIVREYIDSASVVEKDHITNLADVKRRDPRGVKVVPTGYEEVDSLIGGMYGGMLAVWTGYTGSGKSTILSNIILNGVESGESAFVYSGELPKEDFKEWMDLQLSGKKYLSSYYCNIKKQEIPTPNEKYLGHLDNFYDEMVYLYDTNDYATDENIIKAMEYMAKREGTKVFVVDNLITMKITEKGDLNEKQSHLLNRLKFFARTHNAIVHLVAHPKKPYQGQVRVDKYSASGTANIVNLADRVFGFHRLTNEEKAEESKYSDQNNVLMVFKDRKFGIFDEEISFKFDFFSKRYYTNEKEHHREYSWTKNIKTGNMEGFQMIIDPDCPF